MKILYIEPLRSPRVIEIPLELEAMQGLVRGMIEAVYPWNQPAALVCNDNGIAEGLQLNRIVGRDIIHGPFFIAGVDEEDFCSLSDDLIKLFSAQFAEPEVFIPRPDGFLEVIRVKLDSINTTAGENDQ